MPSLAHAGEQMPRFVPIVHADDCGLSPGITDGIVRCHDQGWLQRTSVVANGAGWEHAVAALKRRPALSVAVHLNLFEGTPLSPLSDVDLLVDAHGRFDRSFVGLWVAELTGGRAARLRRQIRLELRRQIERFRQAFEDRGPLTVDSHVHYHLLPPVFDELLALCDEYPVRTDPSAARASVLAVHKRSSTAAADERAQECVASRSVRSGTAGSGYALPAEH